MDPSACLQAIRENPDTPDAYLVYGDWLESQGDPRGEFIAIQAKLAENPDDDALFAREWELLAAHEEEWLGALLSAARRGDRVVCEWRFGFLHTVTMFEKSSLLFSALADCPAAKVLRRLVVDVREDPGNPLPVPHRRAFGPRCEVVVVDRHAPPPSTAKILADANAAMTAVQNEAGMENAWDSEFRVNPYSPWRVAEERLAKIEYLSYLVEHIGSEGQPGHWARFAIAQLGTAAAAASDALREHQCWYELSRVDPNRAKRFGAHRRKPTRSQICHDLYREKGARALGDHLADLLEGDDDALVFWALGSGELRDDSMFERLSVEHPRCVPVARVRQLLEHPDAATRNRALTRLAQMRFPADVDRVIDAILERRATPRPQFANPFREVAVWLGAHPKSDQLLPFIEQPRERLQIVRRRRCAGLGADVEELDNRAADARYTLAYADQLFLDGSVDQTLLIPDNGAHGAYSRVLLNDPKCAPAAFRIAWVERGLGGPITEARIEFLRGLGVSERALEMLATPPSITVPGFDFGGGTTEPKWERATAALTAGLPSLAQRYFIKGSAEALAAQEAAKLQLPTLC